VGAVRVVLDANVLHSARLRDLFLQLTMDGLVQAFWTREIEAEWTSALISSRPELATTIARTTQLIREASLWRTSPEMSSADRPWSCETRRMRMWPGRPWPSTRRL
jgi:hypothetical protein